MKTLVTIGSALAGASFATPLESILAQSQAEAELQQTSDFENLVEANDLEGAQAIWGGDAFDAAYAAPMLQCDPPSNNCCTNNCCNNNSCN